jgi:adaptin ear-binding coat-associated protein 1/2
MRSSLKVTQLSTATASANMDALEDEVESILYIAREISGILSTLSLFASAYSWWALLAVYKIPPLKANEGHRANDWGDLANPLWKGRLRIIEKSQGAALYFEDPQTGES